MIGDIEGYVFISQSAKIVSVAPDSHFQGKVCRVIDWGCDNSALVLNNETTAMAMIESEDIISLFKCSIINNLVVAEPNISLLDSMIYYDKCMNRKGGYNSIVQQLVIGASLHKGVFTDSLLWQKEREEQEQRARDNAK